jgi:hypothetical protein
MSDKPKTIALPPRIPNSRLALSDLQMMFLDCHILRVGPSKLLFRLILGMGKSESTCNSLANALLNSADGREYIKTRTEQLNMYYFPAHERTAGGSGDAAEEGDNMETFQQKLFTKISKDLEQGLEDGTIDYKSGSIIEKFMQKALDYEAKDKNAPEPPKVFLPESCSKCRYRIFCESEEVMDDCKWCRYRKKCEEQGIVYDVKNQLDIPNEEEAKP